MNFSKRTVMIEEQRRLMFDFLRKNPLLIRGKFSSTFTFLDAKRKWIQLRDILNSVPDGAQKKWRSWRKTWQDLRSRTKSKIAKIRERAIATGEIVETITRLSQSERAVMALTSPGDVKDEIEVVEPSSIILLEPMVHSPKIPIIESVVGCSRDYPEPSLSYYKDNELVEMVVPPSQNLPKVIPPVAPLAETQIKWEEEQIKLEEEHINLEEEQDVDVSETVPKPAKEMKQKRILASEKLLECLTTSLNMKEKYYEEKIALLRRDVAAKEEIVKILALIATNVIDKLSK